MGKNHPSRVLFVHERFLRSLHDVQPRIGREMPNTPLRTTSTISPNAATLAMNSPISISVLVSSTM